MQVIPWGKLEKDPPSWILAECIPSDFEWKDPSHIQVAEVRRLLKHWKDRQDQGLDPLIWVPTCPLFEDTEETSKRVRTVQQARDQQPIQDSDEEVFVLPSSEGSYQEDNGSDDNASLAKSSNGGNSSDSDDEDSGGSDMEPHHRLVSHQAENSSCENHIHFLTLNLSHMHHIAMEDDGGPAVSDHNPASTSRATLDLGSHFIYSFHILLMYVFHLV